VAVAELSRSRSRSLGRYDAVADVKKANGGVKYDAFNAAFCKVSTNVWVLLTCLPAAASVLLHWARPPSASVY
jgi:hypothetical protein